MSTLPIIKLEEITDYNQIPPYIWQAFATKLGGLDNLKAVLRGEKDINLIDVIIRLFNKNGRRIPPRGLQAAVCDANRKFYLTQPPDINLAERFNRLVQAWSGGVGMSDADFEKELALTRADFEAIELLKPLLNGVCLPLLLPQLDFTDYGNILDTVILPAAERAYLKQFPERKFVNYRKGDLAGKVSIITGVRHERIVECVKHGPQVVLYFPNALQGYSVRAQREQMATLPEQISLAGFERVIGHIMYTETLARDVNTPGYDLSALQWQQPERSLCLGAYDDELRFDGEGDLGDANDCCSGGLVFSR
jgi:hypothetical protein